MPAVSEKQRRAAGAELRRRREGRAPLLFRKMSIKELRKMASSITHKRAVSQKGMRRRAKRRRRRAKRGSARRY